MAKKVKARAKEAAKAAEIEIEEESRSLDTFIQENSKLLLVGLGVIALLVVGYLFYLNNLGQQNLEANTEMFRAVKEFERDSLDKALTGGGQFLGFEEIAEVYSGTEAANLATYYIGIIYLRKGELETGIDYLESFSKSDNMLSASAYMAMGFAEEDLGNSAKAASHFEKAARTPDENDSTTPTMLLNAGRNYEAAGQLSKALNLYEEIKEEYPLSSEGINIDKNIGRVSQ
ncbi:MAG: tetratricopeptide repeat protein [Bacteroidota bacterium]